MGSAHHQRWVAALRFVGSTALFMPAALAGGAGIADTGRVDTSALADSPALAGAALKFQRVGARPVAASRAGPAGLLWMALAVVAALVGAAILSLAGVTSFQDDAAQYVSTANHLLAGDGPVTSILYYESQLAQSLPAAQTVWPSGFPALAAAWSALTGLPVARSLLVVALLAHLATAAMMVGLGRWMGLGRALSFAAAFAWLLGIPAWLSVGRGLSDPVYQAFALLGALALGWFYARSASGTGRAAWPLGVLALSLAAAVAVRYQAVAMFPVLVLAASLPIGAGRDWRRALGRALLAVLPAGVLLGWLFARNLGITGSLTGGAHASRGQTLAEVASRIEWIPSAWQGTALTLLGLSSLACALGGFGLWARAWQDVRRGRVPPRGRSATRLAVGVYCLLAYAGNVGLLLVLSLSSTVYVFEMRYFLASLMFLVVPILWTVQAAVHGFLQRAARGLLRSRPGAREWVEPMLALSVVAAAIAQVLALAPAFADRMIDAPPAQIERLLSRHQWEGRPVLQALQEAAQRGEVMLSSHPHGLALITGAPTIGIPVPVYTVTPLGEPQIRAQALRHGAAYLVAFRGMPTWVYRDPVNRMLDAHACLGWLQPVLDTPDLLVARIAPASGNQCPGEAPPARPGGLVIR